MRFNPLKIGSVCNIYGKHTGQKRFAAMDLTEGTQVANLIYATVFYNEDEVKKVVNNLNANNPDWIFEFRLV